MDDDEDEAELNALEDSAELLPELMLLFSIIELFVESKGSVSTECTELDNFMSDGLDVCRNPVDDSFGDDDTEREDLIMPELKAPVGLEDPPDADKDDEVSSSIDDGLVSFSVV